MDWEDFEKDLPGIDDPINGFSEIKEMAIKLREKVDKRIWMQKRRKMLRNKMKADFETMWRNCNVYHHLKRIKDWVLDNKYLRLKLEGIFEKLDLYDGLEVSDNSVRYLRAYFNKYGGLPQQLLSYEFARENIPTSYILEEDLMYRAMYGLAASNFIIYTPIYKRKWGDNNEWKDKPIEYIYMENGDIEFIRSEHKYLINEIFRLHHLDIVSYPDLEMGDPFQTRDFVNKFQRMGVSCLQLPFYDYRDPKIMDYNGMRIYNFNHPSSRDEFIVDMKIKLACRSYRILEGYDEY